ncbi:MAG: CHRD domain-containing protein [Actinomycetota bacterium]
MSRGGDDRGGRNGHHRPVGRDRPGGQGIGAGQFDKLVEAIRAGVTYVNAHSPQFPAGEIRGQLSNDSQRQP